MSGHLKNDSYSVKHSRLKTFSLNCHSRCPCNVCIGQVCVKCTSLSYLSADEMIGYISFEEFFF